MKFFKIVILSCLIIPQSQAGLGFYCQNALSLALKSYSYHKEYESSLKNIESKLYGIKMLTKKMLTVKKPLAKDMKSVLKKFKSLNGHYLEHRKTITQISSTTSCAENMVKDMNTLQVALKKPLNQAGIKKLNKVSADIIQTLNSIK